MLSPAEAAAEVLRRDDAIARLLPFAAYTHPRWETGAHHRRICDALEAVERGECKRLAIFAPPRHTKSELASRRFPAWYFGRHPDRQVIACSYNDDLATDIGRDVRNLVADQYYRNIFPGVTLAADSAAAGRWHTSQGGVYVSTGVGGTITGRGAHLGIIDDPIKNREEADSERVRENIWKWYTSTFYTRLMPDAAIVLMLTRWHEDDLASRALASEQWTVLELPAIANEGTDNEQALWPEWYPLERLREIRKVLPPRDWSALYQQRPRAEQGSYCQRSWFADRYDELPGVNLYGYSDLAVTEPEEGRDPDFAEHGLFGISADDTLYECGWWHGQTTPDVWIEALIDIMATRKPICWFLEGGVIRRAVEPFLKKRMLERRVYCRIEWVNPIKDKATRGRAFQARAAMGKVRFSRTQRAERVIDNCVAFPGAKHDDAFDVMSGICLVIDQAHPALAKTAPAKPKRHDYDSDRPRPTTWKVV